MIKTFVPRRCPCNLRKLTFGLLLMKKRWKLYLKNLSYEVELLHRDEFQRQFSSRLSLPVVLNGSNDQPVLLSADDINAAITLDELILLMEHSLGR
jgi:hypothetical protein